MKKWIYIGVLVLFFACARQAEKASNMENSMDLVEEEAVSEQIQYQLLVQQKLTEKLELIQLQNAHPEFDLPALDTNVFAGEVTANVQLDSFRILNLQTEGDTTKLLFSYLFKTDTEQVIDTLKGKVIKSWVQLDGKKVAANTFKFE